MRRLFLGLQGRLPLRGNQIRALRYPQRVVSIQPHLSSPLDDQSFSFRNTVDVFQNSLNDLLWLQATFKAASIAPLFSLSLRYWVTLGFLIPRLCLLRPALRRSRTAA